MTWQPTKTQLEDAALAGGLASCKKEMSTSLIDILKRALAIVNQGGSASCHEAYDCSEELKTAIEYLSKGDAYEEVGEISGTEVHWSFDGLPDSGAILYTRKSK